MRLLVFVFVWIVLSAHAGFAQAPNYHSWVSAQGSDSAACTIAAPCATFSGAVNKTNAGGEVSCLTSGSFGGVSIGKSITIDCQDVHAQVSGSTGLSIAIAQADTVVLRGLDIDMGAATNSAVQGIFFTSPGTLIVDKVKISNARVSSGSLSGFHVVTSTGVARIVISNSTFVNNGGPSGGAGIKIAPINSGGAQVTIDHVVASGNTFGIAFDASQTGQGINATVTNSVAASNTNDGIVAVGLAEGGNPVGVTIKNTEMTNNGFGTRSIGNTVAERIDGSTIVGNVTGVSALSGGTILSSGNNIVQVNSTNGTFSGTLPLN